MEHSASTTYAYYCARSDGERLMKYLLDCEYWFKCCTMNGELVIECAVGPDRLYRGASLRSEALDLD